MHQAKAQEREADNGGEGQRQQEAQKAERDRSERAETVFAVGGQAGARAAAGHAMGAFHVQVGEIDLHTRQEHQKYETELSQECQQRVFMGHPAEAAAADDDSRQDFADDDRQP